MTYREVPPVLYELMRLLPPPGAVWPHPERDEWFKAFAAGMNLSYGPPYVEPPAPPVESSLAVPEAPQ